MRLKYFLLLIITSTIIHQPSSIAEIRYVSHEGTSTPPYTTWETAADSIQWAVDISVYGDTIIVANGVYKEQVELTPGLTLIGMGMDSCIIDSRDYYVPGGYNAVTIDSNCIIEGFQVIVSNNHHGNGIFGYGDYLIRNNKVINSFTGISIFNSNGIVENNVVENSTRGISIEAFFRDYFPEVRNNFVYYPSSSGIRKAIGTSPKIYNNTILIDGEYTRAMMFAITDSIIVKNNLIISENGRQGINNPNTYTLNFNNQLYGKFIGFAIKGEDNNIIINNNVTNGNTGIVKSNQNSSIVQYNNSWNNSNNYSGFTPDSTNLSVNPMVVNPDSLDFHLQKYSPLIDAGDPDILDIDGSRSDIGLWGGPYGERYTYQDLAPETPANLTAEYIKGTITLNWNRNTEADFSYYRVYRDTVENFIYDTTKIIGTTADTFFVDNIEEKYLANTYYYKITAMDSTGNQSPASEEVMVIITGAPEAPPKVVEEFKLLPNYPNPFNPSTKIPYRLKEAGHVRITIYNLLGEIVRVLVDEYQHKGYYEVVFNPSTSEREKGEFGRELPTYYGNDIATGIYLYSIQVNSNNNIPVFRDMRKMMLLK